MAKHATAAPVEPKHQVEDALEQLYRVIAATDSMDTPAAVRARELAFIDAPPAPRKPGCFSLEVSIALGFGSVVATEDQLAHMVDCTPCDDRVSMLRRMHEAKRSLPAHDKELQPGIIEKLRQHFIGIQHRLAASHAFRR